MAAAAAAALVLLLLQQQLLRRPHRPHTNPKKHVRFSFAASFEDYDQDGENIATYK